MELKEIIKSKVDLLNLEELKLVEEFLDSIHKKKVTKKRPSTDQPLFNDAIKLLGPKGLTTFDINHDRKD